MTPADSQPPPQPPAWPMADDAIQTVMRQMLTDGSWGRYHGPHCDALRATLAEYHAVEHVHLCSSGTAAIELALRAVQVQPGDEVILAAYDYKANFANVLAIGARPVLVDTLPRLPVLDPAQLDAAVTPATRAVVCSHLHGCLAQVESVVTWAHAHQLAVVEDACQVPGARLQGRRAGTIGDVGALSFGGSKLLTAGRGGAVLTRDATAAQRLKLQTHRGNDAYPLSEMQAAVLLPQLQQLDKRNQQRKSSVQLIRDLLVHTSAMQLLGSADDDTQSVWYKVAFLLNEHQSESRDEFAKRMRSAGVAMDPGFPALHLTHAKSRFRQVGSLAHATELHHRLLTLHHPVLLSNETVLRALADQLQCRP